VWSSILCDVSGPVVGRSRGLSKVKIGGEGGYIHGLWTVLARLS
jgi:hypothetical protein